MSLNRPSIQAVITMSGLSNRKQYVIPMSFAMRCTSVHEAPPASHRSTHSCGLRGKHSYLSSVFMYMCDQYRWPLISSHHCGFLITPFINSHQLQQTAERETKTPTYILYVCNRHSDKWWQGLKLQNQFLKLPRSSFGEKGHSNKCTQDLHQVPQQTDPSAVVFVLTQFCLGLSTLWSWSWRSSNTRPYRQKANPPQTVYYQAAEWCTWEETWEESTVFVTHLLSPLLSCHHHLSLLLLLVLLPLLGLPLMQKRSSKKGWCKEKHCSHLFLIRAPSTSNTLTHCWIVVCWI